MQTNISLLQASAGVECLSCRSVIVYNDILLSNIVAQWCDPYRRGFLYVGFRCGHCGSRLISSMTEPGYLATTSYRLLYEKAQYVASYAVRERRLLQDFIDCKIETVRVPIRNMNVRYESYSINQAVKLIEPSKNVSVKDNDMTEEKLIVEQIGASVSEVMRKRAQEAAQIAAESYLDILDDYEAGDAIAIQVMDSEGKPFVVVAVRDKNDKWYTACAVDTVVYRMDQFIVWLYQSGVADTDIQPIEVFDFQKG